MAEDTSEARLMMLGDAPMTANRNAARLMMLGDDFAPMTANRNAARSMTVRSYSTAMSVDDLKACSS